MELGNTFIWAYTPTYNWANISGPIGKTIGRVTSPDISGY